MITEKQRALFNQNTTLYTNLLPCWIEEYNETGNMFHDPYVKDWITEFTPIETMVWNDIRGLGVPFYPQIPACGYYLDFANPFLKIAIECDGEAFHDLEKDMIRDAKLEQDGWTVFRIKGHECNRILPEPWDSEFYDEGNPLSGKDVYEWFNTTSTGIIYAIKIRYFSEKYSDSYKKFANENMGEVLRTLNDHVTTKSTFMVLG